MENYRVTVKPSAAKELESIDRKRDREKIVERIRALAGDPRPFGSEKLSGRENHYRVRQGDFRIVYEILDQIRVISIKKIAHRREVYR